MRAVSQHQASAVVSLRSPSGPYGVGAVVKRVLGYGARTDRVPEVLRATRYADDVPVEAADTAAVHRPCVDVIVLGSAFAPRPQPFLDAAVAIGSASRRVRVHGPRRARVRDGRVTFEGEGPLSEARLSYAEAYGGTIQLREDALRPRFGARRVAGATASSYARNPIGRGFALAGDTAALDGALAPSQEDPEDPITPDRLVRRDEADWVGAPTPGGFGPIDLHWYPRVQHVVPKRLVPDGARPREIDLGVIDEAEDPERRLGPDARALSAAAPGLTLPRVRDREVLRLSGMRWGRGEVAIPLDLSCPRVRLTFPGAGDYDLVTRLGTVHVDADAEVVTLVWTAFQPTTMPYPDDQLEGVRIATLAPTSPST